MKEHYHKDCLIIEYSDGSFLATAMDDAGDPIEKTVNSLQEAMAWIDKVETININAIREL